MLWTWRVVYLHVVVVVVVEFCLCFEHVVFYSRVHFCLQLAREKEKCIRESVIFSVVVILWLYKIWVCEFEWLEMHFEFVPKFHDLVICYFYIFQPKDINCMFSDRVPTFFTTRCDKHRVEKYVARGLKTQCKLCPWAEWCWPCRFGQKRVFSLKRYKNEVFLNLH